MKYTYKTKGTCSSQMIVDLDGDVIKSVEIIGGCNGNAKGICSLVKGMKADDVIARWIALHPQDEHYVISSDTDFVQLLAPNVSQYNGITDELHTVTGIFDAKGRRVQDKKTKTDKMIPDPEWLLFEKCMRGDTSDNVFSAYPGVREKGTKNRVGLREAFEDRMNRGFNFVTVSQLLALKTEAATAQASATPATF